jgi:hypothetical protein
MVKEVIAASKAELGEDAAAALTAALTREEPEPRPHR